MKTRVSVLLPVRNATQTLPACLASLFAQSLREFEIVAVDDHSADGTADLLAGAAGRDDCLRLLPNPGRGLVAALETGRRACRGELIARMDADDLAHPDRLRAQVEHLTARPDLVACGTRVRIFPRYRLRTGWRRYETWLNRLVDADWERWPGREPGRSSAIAWSGRAGARRAISCSSSEGAHISIRAAATSPGSTSRVSTWPVGWRTSMATRASVLPLP